MDRHQLDLVRGVAPSVWPVTNSTSSTAIRVVKSSHFAVLSKGNLGIAHQLRGMPGAFYYEGPEEVDLGKSGSLKEELELGEVNDSKLGRVHEILSQVRIDTVESSRWNCQDWALDGLERLKEEGFIYEDPTREAVKNWLKEDV
ncbi:hypothetical protein GE09DRAFT_1226600 [Coniochaeta sp. 2T2.1]|nr:hypothetical protein GE09DRAFT_1226600 [Coniochaeta sp. 2T2.1]